MDIKNNQNYESSNNEKKNCKDNYEKAIFTQNKLFRIEIYNPLENDKNFNFIYSKDNKYYLISEKEKPFQIRMFDMRSGSKPFGSVLFIDGKEIQKIKTSTVKGTYFGFKKGGGEYEFFIFAEPDIGKELIDISNINKSNTISQQAFNANAYLDKNYLLKNFGTIKIDFFDTHKEERDKINQIFKDIKEYIPNKRELDKKFCIRNQTVRKGRMFRRDVTYNPQKFYLKEEMKFIVNIVDFEKKIDSLMIQYQDFLSMNVLGLVNY